MFEVRETQVVTPYTTPFALMAGNTYFSLAPTAPWLGRDPKQQKDVADALTALLLELPKVDQRDFFALATPDVDQANAILAKEGFDVRLEPVIEESVALVAIMKLLGKWIVKGTDSAIYCEENDRWYPGALVDKGVEILKADGHASHIAKIYTREGYEVIISALEPGEIPMELTLADFASYLYRNGKTRSDFEGVHFPQINLNLVRNYEHLLGLYTFDGAGERWYVSQAVGQTILQVNHCGFLAKDAVALMVMKECCLVRNPLPIDKPFVFAVFRNGHALRFPLITAYLTRDVWKATDLS